MYKRDEFLRTSATFRGAAIAVFRRAGPANMDHITFAIRGRLSLMDMKDAGKMSFGVFTRIAPWRCLLTIYKIVPLRFTLCTMQERIFKIKLGLWHLKLDLQLESTIYTIKLTKFHLRVRIFNFENNPCYEHLQLTMMNLRS